MSAYSFAGFFKKLLRSTNVILEGIRGKTKRDVEAFLSRFTPEGTLNPGFETVQVTQSHSCTCRVVWKLFLSVGFVQQALEEVCLHREQMGSILVHKLT